MGEGVWERGCGRGSEGEGVWERIDIQCPYRNG